MFREPYGIQLSRLFRSLTAKAVTEDVETLYMTFYILLLSHYLTNTKETEVNFGMFLSFKAKRKK